MNAAFLNSKFHQKRINKAAVKVQALCRAFLAQARIFRQRKLEPRLQELKDCEARKQEELSRVAQQLIEEREKAPEDVKRDFEASEEVITKLKQDIDYYTKENEELKQQRKEAKKKNKELQLVNNENNEADFKVQVQINKLNKEIKYNQPEAEKYEYALEYLKEQKHDVEESIVRVTQKKSMMKKCIGKIMKMVEEKTGAKKVSPPASPRRGGRRKSVKMGATKTKPARSKSAEDPVPSYDWASKSYDWSASNPIMLEDDSLLEANNGDAFEGSLTKLEAEDAPADKNNSSINSHSKKNASSKSLNNSFDGSLAKLMVADEPADKNNTSVNNSSINNRSKKHAEGGAAFDWATKSYNWANTDINLDDSEAEAKVEAPKQRRQQRHSIHVSSSHHSSSSRSLHKASSSRKLGSKSKEEPSTSDPASMRELLKELKAIKKELPKH